MPFDSLSSSDRLARGSPPEAEACGIRPPASKIRARWMRYGVAALMVAVLACVVTALWARLSPSPPAHVELASLILKARGVASQRIKDPRLATVSVRYWAREGGPVPAEARFVFLDGVAYDDREEAVFQTTMVDLDTGRVYNTFDALDVLFRDVLGKKQDLRGYTEVDKGIQPSDVRLGPDEALRIVLPSIRQLPLFTHDEPLVTLALEAHDEYWRLEAFCRQCNRTVAIWIRMDRSAWVIPGCAHIPQSSAPDNSSRWRWLGT